MHQVQVLAAHDFQVMGGAGRRRRRRAPARSLRPRSPPADCAVRGPASPGTGPWPRFAPAPPRGRRFRCATAARARLRRPGATAARRRAGFPRRPATGATGSLRRWASARPRACAPRPARSQRRPARSMAVIRQVAEHAGGQQGRADGQRQPQHRQLHRVARRRLDRLHRGGDGDGPAGERRMLEGVVAFDVFQRRMADQAVGGLRRRRQPAPGGPACPGIRRSCGCAR